MHAHNSIAFEGAHPDFTYCITWEGGYVLSITNSKRIVDYSGADPVVDLARCPPWVPNLAFSKVYVTLNRLDPLHTILLLDGGERGDFYIRSPESK